MRDLMLIGWSAVTGAAAAVVACVAVVELMQPATVSTLAGLF